MRWYAESIIQPYHLKVTIEGHKFEPLIFVSDSYLLYPQSGMIFIKLL